MKIEEIKHNFATNIIKLRKSKNINQIEFGKAIHYSSKAISKWENEETIPDIDTLSEIAQYFNVSVDDLISNKNIVKESHRNRNIFFITLSSGLLPYFIALIVYIILHINKIEFDYAAFSIAGVISGITLIVLTRIFYPKYLVYLSTIFTVLMAGLTSLLFTRFDQHWWLILVVTIGLCLLLSAFFAIHIPSQDKSLRKK